MFGSLYPNRGMVETAGGLKSAYVDFGIIHECFDDVDGVGVAICAVAIGDSFRSYAKDDFLAFVTGKALEREWDERQRPITETHLSPGRTIGKGHFRGEKIH